jgi:hypothetical protein
MMMLKMMNPMGSMPVSHFVSLPFPFSRDFPFNENQQRWK